MFGALGDLSFNYQFWFAIACALGCLQMVTDEFFFGGACIGALITGLVLFTIGAETHPPDINASVPYVLCGAFGLVGATVMRRVYRKDLDKPDINEEPYDDEND